MQNKRATIKDIAKYTGFSIATISLVLNNNANNIPDVTKEKIFQAAKELNYVQNAAARSLVSGTSKTIGILIPDISNSFFSTLVHDIQIELSKLSYDIILCNSDEKMENDIKYINLLYSRGVDGIILSLSAESMQEENQETIKKILASKQTPYIFLDRYFSDSSNIVMVDNNMAGYEVAKTLFEYGHRRIGLITGPHSLNSSQNRYNGFILFLKEHNLTIEPNLIYEGKYDYDSGFIGTKQLIENKATAIFAFNDLEAYGVLSYCSENHIKVPEDLSIIGFDNLETSAMINPKLSTVEQPIASLAVNASEMIISLIEKKPCEKEIKLNTKLILRDSLRRI